MLPGILYLCSSCLNPLAPALGFFLSELHQILSLYISDSLSLWLVLLPSYDLCRRRRCHSRLRSPSRSSDRS